MAYSYYLLMDVLNKLFNCTRCGFCCQGETTVSLDENDLARMANELELEPEKLQRQYLRKQGSVVQMQTVDGHCIFYADGCTVHAGRPWRCAQWPLVPALLNGEDNFIIIRDSCPGITRELSYKEFCQLLRDYLKSTVTVVC